MRVSQEGFAKGVRILHFLGGTSIDLAGERAIAQTKMTISQRAPVHDVLCDVVCTGRFYDFLEKRQDPSGVGRWGIVRCQPIYEKDRIDPVDPAASLRLDQTALAALPEGYRHLAYMHVYSGANGGGGEWYDCSFTSIPQCRATAFGRSAICDLNPYYPVQGPPQRLRYRHSG